MTVLLWVVGLLLVVAGLAGIVFPALPGTILIFGGLLLMAWADGFTRVGAGTLVLVGAIGAASYTVDFVAAALGASASGQAGWPSREQRSERCWVCRSGCRVSSSGLSRAPSWANSLRIAISRERAVPVWRHGLGFWSVPP